MNKTQLIDALADRFEGNRKLAAHALDSVLDTITREVERGEKVAITGFGSFEKRIREARWVRNPRTGDRIQAAKTAVPKFTPGADLRNIISGAKALPELVLAAVPGLGGSSRSSSRSSGSSSSASGTGAAKTAAKKTTTAAKAPAKKASTAAKKTTTAAKKSSAKKAAPAKKTTAKATTAKATPAKKSTAKKTTAKKAPASTSTAAKSTATKSTAKKTPAKKS